MSTQKLELLAPARTADIGRTAIVAGADAVYIGASAFGARSAATNSIADIASLADFAHAYNARVYVTMNTILYEDELETARRMAWQLYNAGADALIVQDMAYLSMKLPPIALHASTQCNISSPAKARTLAEAGFSQLVLPREFTLEEIKACREAAGVAVEVFVHGALCVSYSGNCHAGCAAMGRSANRGECPQMCRLPYELVDKSGRTVRPPRHYLSLRDLRHIDMLQELADAGASSFKIEGRLKDARYVANVVRAYSQALDTIVRKSDGKYARRSSGTVECDFTPNLDKTFNRSYTTYFLTGKPGKMASAETPKWRGETVGTVSSTYDTVHKSFKARLSTALSNGDGLCYFDAKGKFHGFRLNRVDGATLYPASSLECLTPGTILYRNNDKNFTAILDNFDKLCRRTIALDISLRPVDDQHIAIAAHDERGCGAEILVDAEYMLSHTPQEETRRRLMERTGDTIYRLRSLDDRLGERFAAASTLSRARREVLALLEASAQATYVRERRRKSTLADDAFSGQHLDYHSNIANSLSKKFHEQHGATVDGMALEVEAPATPETIVMQTRYCLRRELGACLREKNARQLPSPLFLRNESGLYRLDFHCDNCGMDVVRYNNKHPKTF